MINTLPEFHYCAGCGFLAEGGRDLKCHCIHAQPRRLIVRAEQINQVRQAIAQDGQVRV